MELTVVLSGFGSGYGGTGHKGLSRALCLLSLSRIPFVETWLEKREFKAVDQQRISPELFDHLRQKAYTEGPESPLLYGYVLQDHVDLLAAGEFLRALHTHLGHSPRLQTEWLDKEVQQRSGGTFHSDPETAVFNAFKVLETRLRSRTGATEGSGTDLVREAFHPESGALANPALPKAEREGVYLLFRGAFMALRNPRGHRFLDEEDTMANIESLMLADLMLRIVDAAPQTATQ